MKRSPRGILASIAILLLLVSLAFQGSSMNGRAQAGDPYSMIAAVNGLRAANGLPAYQVNSILMSIAQTQTDYQAAIEECTHTGAGGTRPIDRAIAAGYGGGQYFSFSENFVCGTNLSVEEAISRWLEDEPHTLTMLGAQYQMAGAGVTVVGDYVYYTLDVASNPGGGNYVPPATYTPGGPTAIPIQLVQTSTPNPDGSVIHTVLYGQYLETIATAYGLTVAELKELNHLTSDAIYVDDILIIRLANTPGPTSTSTGTSTPTRAATATRMPTRTPSPSPSPRASAASTLIVASALVDEAQTGGDPLGNILVIAIVVMSVGGVVLMVVGSVIKRSNKD